MKGKYKDYSEITQEFGKDIFIIEYPFRWGGQFQDKRFWCAIEMETGDAYDYHKKEHLKKDLDSEGRKWVVVRWHKNKGGISIMECSLNLNKESSE